jgi:hypothetical protein
MTSEVTPKLFEQPDPDIWFLLGVNVFRGDSKDGLSNQVSDFGSTIFDN